MHIFTRHVMLRLKKPNRRSLNPWSTRKLLLHQQELEAQSVQAGLTKGKKKKKILLFFSRNCTTTEANQTFEKIEF